MVVASVFHMEASPLELILQTDELTPVLYYCRELLAYKNRWFVDLSTFSPNPLIEK